MGVVRQVFDDVLQMPYHKGGYTQNAHELAFEDLLIEHAFVEFFAPTSWKSRVMLTSWVSGGNHDLVPDQSYISQPGGSNGPPDFVVKGDGRMFFVELKSSQSCKPTYNDTLPKPNFIYVFCSCHNDATDQQTTMFLGSDVVDDESRERLLEAQQEMKLVAAIATEKIQEIPTNDRGWYPFPRMKFEQKGGWERANYFKHSDRARCEQNVLDFVS